MGICLNCNNQTKRKSAIYCSLICSSEHTKIKSLERYEKGEIKDPKTIKRILIQKKGELCTECDQEPVWNEKPLSLQVDHIDGNSDNNLPNNLRLLCPNCHSQQETSKRTSLIKKETRRNSYLRKYKS